MKLVTCELAGPEACRFVGALTADDHIARLDAVSGDRMSMLAFLDRGVSALEQGKARLAEVEQRLKSSPVHAIKGGDGGRIAFEREEVRLLAPVPRPGKIIHTACNFDQHLSELTTWHAPEWQAHHWDKFHHSHPTGFLQAPSAVTGPDSDIIRPRFTKQLDFEIEIATIIGRRAHYVGQKDALDYVAGFCVFNDISARDIQAREHANKVIMLGKSFDTSAPLGPCLVTIDELDDPQNLDMELRVNGVVRQKSNTKFMHYKIRDLVSWWSNITLEPGDVITSGSPSGVAAGMKEPKWLEPGDIVEATIAGLGTLVNRVVAEPL